MQYKYIWLLLLTSLLWAGNFVVGKTLVHHASPMTLTFLRWAITVLCLFPIVWFTEKKIAPPKSAILPLMLMGITGAVLFNVFQFLALEQSSATNIGLISTLNMMSIAACSALFLKERINILQLCSMFFSLFGVVLVLSKGQITYLLSLQFNPGDLWMVAAVCVWGVYSVCSKRASSLNISPMMAILYSGIFGLLFLLPFNITTFHVSNIDASFMGSILYTSVISTLVCMVLWNIGVKHLGATTSGLFMNFNPIFTSILAFFLLGETMTWIQVIGSCIVILGCYSFSLFKGKVFASHKVANVSA